MRRIRIDRDRCMGSGSCQFHAPHVFDLDDDCRAIVLDVGGDPIEAIRNAIENCPTHAIELVASDD
jgi:ferredoxin